MLSPKHPTAYLTFLSNHHNNTFAPLRLTQETAMLMVDNDEFFREKHRSIVLFIKLCFPLRLRFNPVHSSVAQAAAVTRCNIAADTKKTWKMMTQHMRPYQSLVKSITHTRFIKQVSSLESCEEKEIFTYLRC